MPVETINAILCEDSNGAGPAPVAVVLQSIGEWTTKCEVHVTLHSDFSSEQKELLDTTVDKFSNLTLTHSPLYNELLPTERRHTLYHRIILPLLHYRLDKFLFLDADLLIESDLMALYEQALDGFAVAGVRDPLEDYKIRELGIVPPYLNAGVMLYNAALWRSENLSQKAFEFLIHHDAPRRFHASDQDAINFVTTGRKAVVDSNWNRLDKNITTLPAPGNRIIHFAGPVKPWCQYADFDFQMLFLSYLSRTPLAGSITRKPASNFAQAISIAHQLLRRGATGQAVEWYQRALETYPISAEHRNVFNSLLDNLTQGHDLQKIRLLHPELISGLKKQGFDIDFQSPYQIAGIVK